MAYGIMHKKTKLYFSSFSRDHSIIWSEKEKARKMSFQEAKTQALLFKINEQNVQLKPKRV